MGRIILDSVTGRVRTIAGPLEERPDWAYICHGLRLSRIISAFALFCFPFLFLLLVIDHCCRITLWA